jgi:hypothetical protein
MAATVATPEIKELDAKAEQVEELLTPPRSIDERGETPQAAATRAERREAWHRSVEDAVLDLSNAMPEGAEDYDIRKLLEMTVELRRLLEQDPEAEDGDGEIELATMRTADIVQRVRRRLATQRLDDPQAAVKFLFGVLGGISVSEMSILLGVSTKTIRAWGSGKPVRQKAGRVVLVAQLVGYLRGSMTSRGLLMWFEAARDQLGGRTPRELLDAEVPEAHEQLLALARGLRGQLAD